jgi:hypothetical protein
MADAFRQALDDLSRWMADDLASFSNQTERKKSDNAPRFLLSRAALVPSWGLEPDL